MRISVLGKWGWLGLLSIGILAAFIVCTELYLRWLMSQHWEKSSGSELTQKQLLIHRKSMDAELVYELTPGASAVRDGIHYQVNPQGFRDNDFSSPGPKTKHELRIVVIGDSVAWGWGVEMKDAWPQQLEQLLQNAFPERKISIYNMAVNGYSTRQEVRVLQTKGLVYEPDLVILNYALNDPTIEEGGMWPYFAPVTRMETWYRAKIMWQGLCNTILSYLDRLPSPLPHNDPWDYTTMIHGALFDQVEGSMQELSQMQRDYSFKTLLLITPLFDFKKNEPYPWRNIHNFVGKKSLGYGFDYIDAQEYYGHYNSKQLSVDLIHPNRLGHSIIAEAITQKIISGEWISPN